MVEVQAVPRQRAVVLLSGGQDSTTALYWALSGEALLDVRAAVSFSYGQRHGSELDAARSVARGAGIPHVILPMHALSVIGGSPLIGRDSEILGTGGYRDAQAPEGLPTSFVPGRNLLFLSAAAALAVQLGAHVLVTGVCQTDYSGYPDCRRAFIDSLEKTLALAMPSSCGPFQIATPLMFRTKAATVKLARDLGPECWRALGVTVTCYEGKRPGCGACPACQLRAKGFAEAGEVDPAGARHP